MEYTRTFHCGNSRYEAIGQHGHLVVRRQDWLDKVVIGYALITKAETADRQMPR